MEGGTGSGEGWFKSDKWAEMGCPVVCYVVVYYVVVSCGVLCCDTESVKEMGRDSVSQ